MIDDLEIRVAKTPADFASLADMARELSLFHDEDFRPDPKKFLSDSDWFTALIASVENSDVGFVSCFKGYETHTASRFIEIQNLYVQESLRGKKIGLALMREALELGVKWNIDIFKIGVRKSNTRALSFYRKLGFTFVTEAQNFRGKKRRDRV